MSLEDAIQANTLAIREANQLAREALDFRRAVFAASGAVVPEAPVRQKPGPKAKAAAEPLKVVEPEPDTPAEEVDPTAKEPPVEDAPAEVVEEEAPAAEEAPATDATPRTNEDLLAYARGIAAKGGEEADRLKIAIKDFCTAQGVGTISKIPADKIEEAFTFILANS